MATVATIADTTLVGIDEDQLVTMIVDNQLFGIPILQVQDIVEASKITPVPLAPSAIAGVLNLRGRIVTVVDLRKLLGNNEEVPWESQMGVTVEYKGDLYTLLVDAIGDVRTLPKRDFDKAPSTMEDNVRQLCSGIYRLRGNLLVVLDVSRILHNDVIGATPMLTVEERRNRKNEAVAGSDGGDARRHQLSALMADLNAFESETEGIFGAGAEGDSDDIKARRRASRDRRPVAERWRDVLDEKARKSGQVTYRMREPDEETIETARERMAEEDAEWSARITDAGTPPASEQADLVAPDAPLDETAPDAPLETAASATPINDAAPGIPLDDGAVDLPPSADDLAVDEPATDPGEAAVSSGPAPDPMSDNQDAGAQASQALDTAAPDDSVTDPVPDRGELPWSTAADDAPQTVTDGEPSEQPMTTAGDGDRPPAKPALGGIKTDWWNKLRGKTDSGADESGAADTPAAKDAGESKAKRAAKKAGASKKTAAKKTKAKADGSSKSSRTPKSKPKAPKKKG